MRRGMSVVKNVGPGPMVAKTNGAGCLLEIDGRRYHPKSLLSLASKRVFDVIVGTAGMIVAVPLVVVIAALIKLDSRGPVFYRQTRVGRYHRRFKIWKFRKMRENMPSQGPSLTMRYDFRMTRFGRFLERTKLDELPQLLNVLSGDMSVIGPRPEVPKFVEHYADRWNYVLSVKPGIFGLNQLRNRNESELYPSGCADVEGFYVSHILPDKLEVDAQYARSSGLWLDTWIMVRCLAVALVGVVTRRTLATRKQQAVHFLLLAGLGVGCMTGALALSGWNARLAMQAILIAAVIKPLVLVALRVPMSLALSATAEDFRRLVWSALASAALVLTGLFALGYREAAPTVVLLDAAFFLGALVLYKAALYRVYLTFHVQESLVPARRMIWASAVLGPMSVAAALTLSHGPGWWRESPGAAATLVMLTAIVRPLVMLLGSSGNRREGQISWVVSQWLHVVVAAAVGSCGLALGSYILGQPLAAGVLLLDGLVYLALMTVYAFGPARKAPAHGSSGVGTVTKRERLLIAGSGIELSSFAGALAALPEHRYQIVGVVTPDERHTTSTVGGYEVLGGFLHVPEILKTLKVDKVVVLPGGVHKAGLVFVEQATTRAGCEHVSVPMLSAIVSGAPDGTASPGTRLTSRIERIAAAPLPNPPRSSG